MKSVIGGVLALLLGLVVGGLGPRADLRQARSEIERLKKERPARTADSAVSGVASMLRIPEADEAARTRRRSRGAEPSIAPTANQAEATPSNSAPAEAVVSTAPDGDDEARQAATMAERIQTATDLWRLRVELARNSFVANVAASEEQSAQFDAVMAEMNQRLTANIRAWVDFLKEQPQITPESGVRIMQTLSTDLVQTYDALDGALAPGWREKAGEDFQLFDFVDPQVALPLTEVDGPMRRGGGVFGPRHGRGGSND